MEGLMPVPTYIIPWQCIHLEVQIQLSHLLGHLIECRATWDEVDFWSIGFVNYRMPESELRHLTELLHCSEDEYPDSAPEPGYSDVSSLGMIFSTKLLERAAGMKWRKIVAGEDGLLLIDCYEEAENAETAEDII